jgi:TolA-binding protein
MCGRFLTICGGLLWLTLAAAAQDPLDEWPPDVVRAVRGGMVEVLEARFGGGQSPDELHLIARAHVNKARQQRSAAERERAFMTATDWYQKWIAALAAAAQADPAIAAHVPVAAARVELAGMLVGERAAGELDRFEVTGGRQGDRQMLREVIGAACAEYEAAAATIDPLYAQLREREDELLVLGVYDAVVRLKHEISLNHGWAEYWLGVLTAEDAVRRMQLLQAAESRFQDVLSSRRAGGLTPRGLLGLGLVQRERQRWEEAERCLRAVLDGGPPPALAAQARYELARCHIAAGKFDEARAVLRPLLEKEMAAESADEQSVRFYLNLARLWDANSYLVEADVLRVRAGASGVGQTLLRDAERTHAVGLAKLNRLAAEGGPWPAVVQLYVAGAVDEHAELAQLAPLELLYAARESSERGDHAAARQWLVEAAGRPEFRRPPSERTPEQSQVGGQILMELGRCCYRAGDLRAAAAAFVRLANDYTAHEHAVEAATLAYQLWGQVATASGQSQDYEQLCAALLSLLQRFAEHPRRAEAAWLLPVALQAAGRYGEAGREFAKVPRDDGHWEEAQFRRGVCRRLAFEAQRALLGAAETRADARLVADELLAYAQAAMVRADELSPTEAVWVRGWAAEARVSAAEVLADPGLAAFEAALAAVADFEQSHGDGPLVGRVLAVRIRAQLGLRRFEAAAAGISRYLEVVPVEEAGALLPELTRSLQEEVRRLEEAGEAGAARELAVMAANAFARLEEWLRSDPARAGGVAEAAFGRAQVLYAAGELEAAERIAAELCAHEPRNGNYRRLLAQILTSQLGESASAAEVRRAQEAWGELLKDARLRERAPARFWEARYQWLALLLRAGQAADVAHAIAQERIWHPELGGSPWRERLLALEEAARAQAGAEVGGAAAKKRADAAP